MMVSVETFLRRRHRQLQQWTQIPLIRDSLEILGCGAGGFVLSAASLANSPQPFAMGMCCASAGLRSLAAGVGSILGYRLFWGQAGLQSMIWAGVGTGMGLLLRKPRICQEMPLLIPAMAAFFVSVVGLIFQILWADSFSFGIYVLQVVLAGSGAWLFEQRQTPQPPIFLWLRSAIFVLALAQIAPVAWLNPGFLACGAMTTGQSLSQAILAGLGLDLARITPVPMTAVACLSGFTRMIPMKNPLWKAFLPCGVYLGLMLLLGCWDLTPVFPLLMGSVLGLLIPKRIPLPHGQSGTGYAQVQLELASGVLAQTQQLLLETPETDIDETALLEKVAFRACGNCVLQKDCRERQNLSVYHLHHPLDFACRKPGRILGELRRGREQMLSLRREKDQQQEYRRALTLQYQFLGEYLQSLADDLHRAKQAPKPRYRILVSARSRSKTHANGDVCLAFPGTRCRYYIVLCDGMGTGLGAAVHSRSTAMLLKTMLTAGMSALQAFHSINSLLTLRGQGGLVTLDLAEVELSTGKGRLYKWGAASSWLLGQTEMERLGYATLPPGIGTRQEPQVTSVFSLCRGQALILLSDGADIQEPVLRGKLSWDMAPGELAETILKFSRSRGEDDATAAVLRLSPLPPENTVPKPP